MANVGNNDDAIIAEIQSALGYIKEGTFVLIAYWVSLWTLGVVWWKAPIVAIVATCVFAMGWGKRWISRGSIAILGLALLVWIEALPPPSQWKPIVNSVLVAARQ
jgi:hypothetical protein